MYDFILVNPWIYDFAAYDLWARPLGLLRLAGLLRQEGYSVAFLDCLDPFHPELPRPPRRKAYGTGHYFRQRVPKPASLSDVPRHFSRYGLPVELFLKELLNFGPPKAFLVTSLMTYWYPGVFEAVRLIRKVYRKVPIYVGGIYVKLCEEHASRFLEDAFILAETDEAKILARLKEEISPSGAEAPHPFSAFDLQRKVPYIVLTTSWGCPFSCKYCASKILQPVFKERPPEEILAEIKFWYLNYGVRDFAFYDDALLVNFDRRLGPVLESLLREGIRVRFHTPNAMHIRLITRERAKLLRRAGFRTIRLGFETLDPERHRELDDKKVRAEELEEVVAFLREAGFSRKEIGVYVLWGLPHQDLSEVENSVRYVARVGGAPYLSEYSPIPGTPLFGDACQVARYPLEEDPLFHNNTIFPCLPEPDWQRLENTKRLARKFRHGA